MTTMVATIAMMLLTLLVTAYTPAAAAPCEGWIVWPNDTGQALADAARESPCVIVLPGVHLLSGPPQIQPGGILLGAGVENTVLRADPATWWSHGVRPGAVVNAGPAVCHGCGGAPDPPGAQRYIANLTIDAAHVAFEGIGYQGFVLHKARVVNGACSGVTVAGPGVAILESVIEHNSWPTYVSGLGRTIDCRDNPYGGFVWGAGIYFPPQVMTDTVIADTVLRDNYGPAIDAWGAGGGALFRVTARDNRGWASVHLYDAPNWLIVDSTISHTPLGDFYPHPDCYYYGAQQGAAVRACGASANTTVLRSTLTGGYAFLAGPGAINSTLIQNRTTGFVVVRPSWNWRPPRK